MRPEAIIFDLDGVICHTDRYHYLAWKAIADELDIAFDEKKNDLLRGVSRQESLEIILGNTSGDYTSEQKKAMAEKKNTLYRELLQQMSPADVSDNVRTALNTLRQLRIPIAIGSSSKNAGFILDRLGITDWFDVVVDGNDIRHSKPDPEVFLLAAERLGKNPADCMVVEDAEAGIQAAQAGGFRRVAIGAAVAQMEADYHIQQLDELLTAIR